MIKRYIEIWNEIQNIPVSERPLKLQQEMDQLWDNFSKDDKRQIDQILEASA